MASIESRSRFIVTVICHGSWWSRVPSNTIAIRTRKPEGCSCHQAIADVVTTKDY